MNLSGHTKPYAVLGHPIGHTLSPVMHNAAFQALGMDAVYMAFDVAPDRLISVLPSMADMGFGGVNLTVPLKQTAFEGLRDHDASSKMFRAVNTVQFLGGGNLKAHNTDSYGFLQAFDEAFQRSVEGKSVLVIGTGGAGRTVALTCASAECGKMTLSDADPERARKVASETGRRDVILCPSEPEKLCKACRRSDVVIQATPVGMKPDDPVLVPRDGFHEGQLAFDLIYIYPMTRFMKEADASGARVSNGLGMLLHQGARAFQIWTDVEPPVEEMRRALENEVYGNRN
ncbi:MAG: shikimate dehydrogenase [Kiritimatiellia bacterium]